MEGQGLPRHQQGVLLVAGEGKLSLYRGHKGKLPLPGAAPNAVPGAQRPHLGKRQGQQPPDQVVGGRWPNFQSLIQMRRHSFQTSEEKVVSRCEYILPMARKGGKSVKRGGCRPPLFASSWPVTKRSGVAKTPVGFRGHVPDRREGSRGSG